MSQNLKTVHSIKQRKRKEQIQTPRTSKKNGSKISRSRKVIYTLVVYYRRLVPQERHKH